MTSMLKAPESKRLTLEHEKLLSNFAFKFNLRRYSTALPSVTDRPTLVIFSYVLTETRSKWQAWVTALFAAAAPVRTTTL
jgi:hypothetical protein